MSDGAAPGDSGAPPSRPYRFLVVCTANQCRSVIAEALWRRQLAERGVAADVRSAGLGPSGWPASDDALAALAAHGIDASAHRTHQLGAWVSRADLVVTMANEHVREVAVLDRPTLGRTFTLRQAARRAGELGPRRPGQPLEAWIARLGEGRRLTDLLIDGGPDDVADPTGLSFDAHLATVRLLDDLLRLLTAAAFPTPSPADGAGAPAVPLGPHARRARLHT